MAKKKKQILVISQGAVGRDLSKLILDAAKSLKGYKFIYKLHPGEYDRWKEEYPELVLASKLPNVEVIDNNLKDIYLLFAESEYQIGIFSTAIYEGLSFNCKTLLVDLPGIEYMEYLIKKGIVKKVNDIKELKAQLEDFKVTDYKDNYFFC